MFLFPDLYEEIYKVYDPSKNQQDNVDNIVQAVIEYKVTQQIGQGNANSSLGLWNYQINDYMKPFKKHGFLGTIASDEIPTLVKSAEPLMSFIMNTLPSTAKESEVGHWVAVYIDINVF